MKRVTQDEVPREPFTTTLKRIREKKEEELSIFECIICHNLLSIVTLEEQVEKMKKDLGRMLVKDGLDQLTGEYILLYSIAIFELFLVRCESVINPADYYGDAGDEFKPLTDPQIEEWCTYASNKLIMFYDSIRDWSDMPKTCGVIQEHLVFLAFTNGADPRVRTVIFERLARALHTNQLTVTQEHRYLCHIWRSAVKKESGKGSLELLKEILSTLMKITNVWLSSRDMMIREVIHALQIHMTDKVLVWQAEKTLMLTEYQSRMTAFVNELLRIHPIELARIENQQPLSESLFCVDIVVLLKTEQGKSTLRGLDNHIWPLAKRHFCDVPTSGHEFSVQIHIGTIVNSKFNSHYNNTFEVPKKVV